MYAIICLNVIKCKVVYEWSLKNRELWAGLSDWRHSLLLFELYGFTRNWEIDEQEK